MVRVTPLLLLLCAPALLEAEKTDYASQVKPLLQRHCYSCHGALKQEGGLRLDTAAAVRKGGDSGTATIAGKPAESLLIERVREADADLRMPLESKPLTDDQIALLERWITAGATGPVDEKPEPDPREHWAFNPPRRPALPAPSDGRFAANAIDRFIGARLEQAGLTATPPARPEIQLRRVYLDLIGLPPTREELRRFVFDPSDEHYERIVQRLLANPQYGERWGRHWMDVWRYSDWYGRRNVNDVRNSYPHIWHWRDWIVRSLNEDKGYGQMVHEMLAADEFVPESDEDAAALGFIVRNWFSLNYDVWMKDLVEHTGKAFLGLRLNCAHCHDHKYDPISNEDYFRFRAFFEPIELRHDRLPGGPALSKYKRYVPGSGASLKPATAGLPRVFDKNLEAETFMYRLGDARDRIEDHGPVAPDIPRLFGTVSENIHPVDLPPRAWYPGLKQYIRADEIAAHEKTVAEMRQQLIAAIGKAAEDDASKSSIAAFAAELTAAGASLDSLKARIAADRARYLDESANADQLVQQAIEAQRRATLLQAEASVKRAEHELTVAAAKLSVNDKDAKQQAAVEKAKKQLAAAKSARTKQVHTSSPSADYQPLSPQYPRSSTGRRAALAAWITDRQNPLTARVAVNHIWMRHFGRPLVDSVFDFGRSGAAPSHPKLLDWLAVDLMDSGWSMKRLHQLIVTSRTYRMSSKTSAAPAGNRNVDPDNRLLWHYPSRRVEAEVIRDSILATSGRLDTRIGGAAIDPKTEAKTLRRSLYFSVYPEAGGMMPFMARFDAPDPCDAYRRSTTVVPQQALAMSNSQIIQDASRELEKTLSRGAAATDNPRENFISSAFEQILTRPPTVAEQRACHEFLERQIKLLQASANKPSPAVTAAARAGMIRALYNHNDFLVVR